MFRHIGKCNGLYRDPQGPILQQKSFELHILGVSFQSLGQGVAIGGMEDECLGQICHGQAQHRPDDERIRRHLREDGEGGGIVAKDLWEDFVVDEMLGDASVETAIYHVGEISRRIKCAFFSPCALLFVVHAQTA